MDGYDDQDIATMSKNKPRVRQTWQKYLEAGATERRVLSNLKLIKQGARILFRKFGIEVVKEILLRC